MLLAVFLPCFVLLGVRAARAGMASGFIDPVSRIDAQDEALYAHSAIRMAEDGGWSTPTFLGRMGLYKPPLLMWSAGVSARLLGVSTFALRLPSLLLAAFAACAVFAWVRALRPGWAGVAAVLLLVSDHLWYVLSGMCLTDGFLTAFITLALYALFRDPAFERRASVFAFSLASAAAILTKSVAGALPLLVAAVFWLVAGRPHRPGPRRLLLAASILCAAALPWFAYQAAVHTRWFLAEHIGVEIVSFGAAAPAQTSQESQVAFYLKRLWLLDPFLILAAAAGVPALARGLRGKSPAAKLLLCWIAVVLGAAFLWSYRNVSYLMPAFPALAILAAANCPALSRREAILILIALFGFKAWRSEAPWGLPLFQRSTVAAAPALTRYCELRRAAELVVVEPDDAFYSALLPLERVRYCFIGDERSIPSQALNFRYLGLMIDVRQFGELRRLRPQFEQRLRDWGMESGEAVATTILARSEQEVTELIRRNPEMDFFLPRKYLTRVPADAHVISMAAGERFFLLSANAKAQRKAGLRGCSY